MSWQLLTAISVVNLSLSVILQRILLHKNKTDPYAYVVTFQAIVGVLITIFAMSSGFHLPNIQSVLIPAVISIIFFGLGHIVYAKTLQHVEASAFSVLFATQAIWIMLLGIVFFHENLTTPQIVGSLLIFFSVTILIKEPRKLFKDKGTLLGLATGCMFGIAITCWSYVGRHTDPLSWAAASFLGSSLIALLLRPQSLRKAAPLLRPAVLSKLLLLGIFYAMGSVAMLYAYKLGTFTIVSPLRQTSILVTVLFALALLPAERNRIARKIIAAFICIGGVILIVL